MAKLTVADVKDLNVVVNTLHLRQDLHLFVEYVQNREVKRAYRSNNLGKADAKRLAKLMSDPDALDEIKNNNSSDWVDYIDNLAFMLGFVTYNTLGLYAGDTSLEPSFPDNYIQPIDKAYNDFLGLSLVEQERKLLQTMINDYKYDKNEFMSKGIFSLLDPFNFRGCATGVLPTLNFAQARSFLLDLLQKFDGGVWYTTKSLIDYLKSHHRYFLIPKKPKVKQRLRGEKVERYGNFAEKKSQWGSRDKIPDDAPDGFERVEGRYIERFLEGIPLILGYVDVAYNKQYTQTVFPAINRLQAFRINDRLRQVMEGAIPEPRVIVQPNFEIQIESLFYPVTIMAKLRPLTKLVSQDTIITLKLDKKKVSALQAQDDSLDIIALLKELTGNRLPQNIMIELQEWASHSEKFTLFDGFGILEGTEEGIALANIYTVEHISPTIKLIREPQKTFKKLEKAELVPLRISHKELALWQLPEKANTVFATKASAAKAKEKPQITLKRQPSVTLHFPTIELLERFCKELVYLNCPAEPNKSQCTVTYSTRYDTEVSAVLKVLGEEYNILMENI